MTGSPLGWLLLLGFAALGLAMAYGSWLLSDARYEWRQARKRWRRRY